MHLTKVMGAMNLVVAPEVSNDAPIPQGLVTRVDPTDMIVGPRGRRCRPRKNRGWYGGDNKERPAWYHRSCPVQSETAQVSQRGIIASGATSIIGGGTADFIDGAESTCMTNLASCIDRWCFARQRRQITAGLGYLKIPPAS